MRPLEIENDFEMVQLFFHLFAATCAGLIIGGDWKFPNFTEPLYSGTRVFCSTIKYTLLLSF